MPRVLSVGSANMDVVFAVDRLVAPGETIPARSVTRTPGGKSANQAVAAARLGAPVSLVARVGADDDGAAITASLAAAGVELSHLVVTTEVPSGTAYICVDDDGENSIVLFAGANALLAPDDLAGVDVADVAVLTLCGEVGADVIVDAARRGRAAGAHVIVNASPVADFPRDAVGAASILVVNEHELRALTDPRSMDDDDLARARRQLDVPALIVTLGAAGAAVVTADAAAAGDAVVRVGAFAVEAVDTTGCGDAFLGALAAQLAAGTSIESGVRFANAVAAIAATAPGAQASYPSRAQVEEFLRSAPR